MKLFNSLNRFQLLKLLAVIALSDGTLNEGKEYKRRLKLLTNKSSIQQHELLNYLSKKVINKTVKSYKECTFLRSSIYSVKLINQLLKLSPSYKTTPYKENKKDFLAKPQPTLKFIFNENKNIQMLVFRFWFDFEGALISRFRLTKKLDRGNIFLMI